MRKLGAYRRGIDFDKRDVEILVDVNHFAIELLASRQGARRDSWPQATWALVAITPVPVTENPEPILPRPFRQTTAGLLRRISSSRDNSGLKSTLAPENSAEISPVKVSVTGWRST